MQALRAAGAGCRPTVAPILLVRVLVAAGLGCAGPGPGGATGAGLDAGPATGAGTEVTSGGPVTASGSFSAAGGYSEQSLTIDGKRRFVALFAPPGAGPAPALVIAFHGTSGEPTDWIDADPTSDPQGLETLAAAHGFLAAAPRARDWGDGASDWDNHSGNNRYWETRFDANPLRGADPAANADLVLVQQIISAGRAAFGVDPRRVYLVGFSNGAFFAEHTAFVLHDRIAAVAEAAGGLVTAGARDRPRRAHHDRGGPRPPGRLRRGGVGLLRDPEPAVRDCGEATLAHRGYGLRATGFWLPQELESSSLRSARSP